MKTLTIAVCTYNRAHFLPQLINELRKQVCPIFCEILFIVNNSTDETFDILKNFSQMPGIKLRYVNEQIQGIAHARNRALHESIESDYLLFIDDDELPSSISMTEVAVKELEKSDVQCVGGRITIDFRDNNRPRWLGDELLGFYAEIDYGDNAFIITDESTPIWTSIIAYDMNIFRNNPNLRFDERYNRVGDGVGGGEDVIMFRDMLREGIKMKYLPELGVRHLVEPHRMTRRYFWKLHFVSGMKLGLFESVDYDNSVFGIPPFMVAQFFKHLLKSVFLFLKRDYYYVRQGMNATHALGMMYGSFRKWRKTD